MALKIGEVLVRQGILRPEQLAKALEEQKKTGQRLTQVIMVMANLKEPQILKALETHFQVPGVDLTSFSISKEVIRLVPRDVCEKHQIIPVQRAGPTLVVAFADPSNIFVRDDLRFITKMKIHVVVATETAVSSAIDKYYSGPETVAMVDTSQELAADEEVELANTKSNDAIDVDVSDESGPIPKFVNAILLDSIRRKASDIHFEPYEKRLRVRLRVDGNMVEASSQPASSGPAIVSRIKIMAKLDIAEKRRPQDGRIKIRIGAKKDMDFRVSVLPTIWGEKVVMRLLDKSNLQLDMTKLGMEADDLVIFKEAIHRPQGLVLITGPTGSGKTTTIYSALADLNQPDVNVSTAEDPVEFNFDGINQVQTNAEIEFTFAAALRSFLRQDPDIIMVGEIRDLETAEIAMKAASTGHLVVSTLHTNDAPQTINRLTEMGIAPYLVTSTLNLIVAQRLVGRICENCKTPIEVEPKVLTDLGVDAEEIPDYKLFKGRGCQICNGTGIKGRLAIFEVMGLNEELRELILKKASTADLRNMARRSGMRTLRRAGLLKLKRGETTIEEVVGTSVKDT
jgi:type IV pilus assembly protein PilB